MSDEISRLKAKLDEVVIGQEGAKIALAVAIRNHYEGLRQGLPKSNILILGPSGTGKTLMVQTIANSLDVPFAVFDASSITQAGYIGGKVKDAVMALAQKAEFNQEKIERGIIFFDEIDKMAARGGRGDSEEFKRQAQATLLKVIEGIEVEVKENEHRKLNIDTSKILFVCAGAFSGLNLSSKVSTDDLIAFGMMPELLGRLPNMITLHELGVSDLERILKNPRSSVLEEYKTRFAAQKIALKFTDGATRAIAEKAAEFRIGARALKTVVARVMADLQFRIGNMGHIQSCTVTERVIRYGDLPLITYR
jgi:ATP-dependent Clp protease ATP-binding subunit ClpX